jgi:hypothetical protein
MATDAQGRQLSEDGNYYWDGANWQLVDAAAGGGSQQSGAGSQDAQGRQLSEDGNYYWDGSNWQPVDGGSVAGSGQAVGSASSSTSDPLDGGLPPGGLDNGGLLPAGTAPERAQCDTGGCPTCASEQSMSSPCIHQIYHQGDHECANGHSWSSGSQAICGANCPQGDGTCELDDLHKYAGIPHEHYVAGGNHKWS